MTGRKISCLLPLHLPLAFVYDIPIKMARVDKVRAISLHSHEDCSSTQLLSSDDYQNPNSNLFTISYYTAVFVAKTLEFAPILMRINSYQRQLSCRLVFTQNWRFWTFSVDDVFIIYTNFLFFLPIFTP